jgi:hypothetical protein
MMMNIIRYLQSSDSRFSEEGEGGEGGEGRGGRGGGSLLIFNLRKNNWNCIFQIMKS